jgi:iron(III) transport system permease protein
MLGAGRARRFVTIDLPLTLPGLAAGGGLVLLSTMKELPITLLTAPTGFQTLATRIWADTESAFLAEAALASIVLVALSGVLTWLLVVRRSDRLA